MQLCLSHGKGGLELYALKIIKWLKEEGCHVCTVSAPGTFLTDCLNDAGISNFEIKSKSRHFPFLTAFRLARLIEKEKIDIIHLHWGKISTL